MNKDFEARIVQALAYDAVEGRLTWKIDISRKCRAGVDAGTLDSRNRKLTIGIDGKQIAAHRVAWFLHYGTWPKDKLAAHDGDFSNLKINNLFEQTTSEAAQRGGGKRVGASGVPGVVWDKDKGRWYVKITRNYKQIAVGRFKTLDEAKVARDRAIAEYADGVDEIAERNASRDQAERVKLRARQRIVWKRVTEAAAGLTGWADFLAFSSWLDGEPKGWSILPIDPSRRVGPDNAKWIDAPIKQYDKTDPESRRAYQRQYRQDNPNLHRAYMLNRNFDMTLAEYTKKLEDQNGVCAICKRPETTIRSGKLLTLAVDHCHTGGQVRGLLCVNCNQGLGSFKDDISTLERAIAYLKSHGA